MKALVTYYSYSGNTERIAKIFGKILEAKGEVHVQRLKPVDEIKSFLGQYGRMRAAAYSHDVRVSVFDLIGKRGRDIK